MKHIRDHILAIVDLLPFFTYGAALIFMFWGL